MNIDAADMLGERFVPQVKVATRKAFTAFGGNFSNAAEYRKAPSTRLGMSFNRGASLCGAEQLRCGYITTSGMSRSLRGCKSLATTGISHPGVLTSGQFEMFLPLDSPDTINATSSQVSVDGLMRLDLAGFRNLSCWTGSPPCQPFSVAGKGLAQSDERHLAPVWLDLVRECRPPILFGEQVADAIRHGWLDDLFDALEECGYACGSAVLPACSVGAPHIRKRLFFGAVRLADAYDTGPQGRLGMPECSDEQSPWSGSLENRTPRGLAHPPCAGWRQTGCDTSRNREADERSSRDRDRDGSSHDVSRGVGGAHGANSHHGGWEDADWLGCRDGKFRPVEPGTQPLANGLPARVGRLRGYGNAIVPQVAATFIQEFIGIFSETSISTREGY